LGAFRADETDIFRGDKSQIPPNFTPQRAGDPTLSSKNITETSLDGGERDSLAGLLLPVDDVKNGTVCENSVSFRTNYAVLGSYSYVRRKEHPGRPSLLRPAQPGQMPGGARLKEPARAAMNPMATATSSESKQASSQPGSSLSISKWLKENGLSFSTAGQEYSVHLQNTSNDLAVMEIFVDSAWDIPSNDLALYFIIFPSELKLPPGESASFRIVKSQTPCPHTQGCLRVEHHAAKLGKVYRFNLKVESVHAAKDAAASQWVISPRELELPGVGAEMSVKIENRSVTPLYFELPARSGGLDGILASHQHGVVTPLGRATLTFKVRDLSCIKEKTRLRLVFNGIGEDFVDFLLPRGSRSSKKTSALSVSQFGDSDSPDPITVTKNLRFPLLSPGTSASSVLVIQNFSSADVSWRLVTKKYRIFRFDKKEGACPAGKSQGVTLRFAPQLEGTYEAEGLLFVADEIQLPFRLHATCSSDADHHIPVLDPGSKDSVFVWPIRLRFKLTRRKSSSMKQITLYNPLDSGIAVLLSKPEAPFKVGEHFKKLSLKAGKKVRLDVTCDGILGIHSDADHVMTLAIMGHNAMDFLFVYLSFSWFAD